MNPFKFGTVVDGDFFTDRDSEIALLTQKLNSENHSVLISPRRFGKSSLVRRVVSMSNRPLIWIDLQYVMNVSDFSSQILKALYKLYPIERLRYAMSHFRIIPTLTMNAVTGALEVSFQPTSNQAILLEDAMSLLDKLTSYENRFIVVFDEFQEVLKIAKGFDKQLRALMQNQKNINYILLGSQESMMENIFERKKSPFYHFGQVLRLDKIPYNDFLVYINSRMPSQLNTVGKDILEITGCHPYYTQQLASQVWELCTYQHLSEDVVQKAVDDLVTSHDLDYERLWLSLNRTDRYTLRQLSFNQQPLQNRNQATSTSYSSLLRLMKMGYVIKSSHYEIEDPFFLRWIRNNNM